MWITLTESTERDLAFKNANKLIRSCILKESKCKTICESDEAALNLAMGGIDKMVKTPSDLKTYIQGHDSQVKSKVKDSKLLSAWEFLKKLVNKGMDGLDWIASHWKAIFLLLGTIALCIFAPRIYAWIKNSQTITDMVDSFSETASGAVGTSSAIGAGVGTLASGEGLKAARQAMTDELCDTPMGTSNQLKAFAMNIVDPNLNQPTPEYTKLERQLMAAADAHRAKGRGNMALFR